MTFTTSTDKTNFFERWRLNQCHFCSQAVLFFGDCHVMMQYAKVPIMFRFRRALLEGCFRTTNYMQLAENVKK